jgi:SEC-C motif-containing protein
MTLKANPRLSRQLTLQGPMLLWRDKRGEGREGLLVTVDVCPNPSCTERHVFIQARIVEETLISAKVSPGKLVTKSRPGPVAATRSGFYGAVGVDDGALELRDAAPDPEAVAWFKAELDAELRAVLLARFEGARRLVQEAIPATAERPAAPSRSPTPSPSTVPAAPVATSGRPGRPGRNDPCPCGSGLKYKRCCLARAA